jgi:hypothetical protein
MTPLVMRKRSNGTLSLSTLTVRRLMSADLRRVAGGDEIVVVDGNTVSGTTATNPTTRTGGPGDSNNLTGCLAPF